MTKVFVRTRRRITARNFLAVNFRHNWDVLTNRQAQDIVFSRQCESIPILLLFGQVFVPGFSFSLSHNIQCGIVGDNDFFNELKVLVLLWIQNSSICSKSFHVIVRLVRSQQKTTSQKRVLALLFNHIVHGWRCNDCRNDIWKKLLNWIHERPWTGETPNTNASNFGDHVLRSDKGKVLSTEARKFAPALVLQTNIIPYHQNAGGVFTIRCLAVAGSKKQLQDQKHWCIRFYNTSRWLKNGIRAQGTFYTVDKKARMWVCEYKRQRERWSIYIDL